MHDRARERKTTLQQSLTREQLREQEQDRQREWERIYGYELMEPDELDRYREQLRQARTDQERNRIREDHRKQMLDRARARGVTLPPAAGEQ